MWKLRRTRDGSDSLRDWLQSLSDGETLAEIAVGLRAAAGGPAAERNDPETIVRYVRPGARSEAELERLCEDPRLRREVASAARLLVVSEKARGNDGAEWLGYRRLGAVALVAASIAGILVVPRLLEDGAAGESHRSATITVAEVQVIGAQGELATAPLVRWQPVLGADLYEVEVTAGDGRMVYTERTEDTELQVPSDVVNPNVPYFYRVRARLEVTRWIASEFREFVVRP